MAPRRSESLVRRSFSYIRFSSKKQERGESRRRQWDFAVEISQENGWVLDETLTLTDLGVSAFRGKNAKVGALAEFLEAVRIGRVPPGSVLIIESIDRLSRNKLGEALQLFISILTSGVDVVTQEPRRHYTRDSINDLAGLLEPLVFMMRAHEESATKAHRLRDVWGKKKERARERGLAMTRNCPRWLELTETGYQLIPDRAETVRTIFRLCREGLGIQRILNHLLGDPGKYPPFGDSGKWRDSYVAQILGSRAAFGEFQPGMRGEDGSRATCGAPIKNYFPAVVTEEEFFEVQALMKSRFRAAGRPGEYETNLFTGIVYCASDKTRMSVHTFRQRTRPDGDTQPYRYLTAGSVASGTIRTGKGLSFPYDPFEQGVLQALSELKPEDLSGKRDRAQELNGEALSLSRKLEVLTHRIQENEAKAADPDEESPETYIGLLKTLQKSKEELTRKLEGVKAEAAASRGSNLRDVQSLLGVLASTEGDKLKQVRRLLKAKVRTLVAEIWVHITHVNKLRRVAHVQLYLRNGATKKFSIAHAAGAAKRAAKSEQRKSTSE